MESLRLPRFKRIAEIASFQLTERDREMVRQIQRHRFLRSSQIIALVGGSPQQVLRRLQLLFHHGYLDRPRAQIDYYREGGSRHLVYGLGRKGISLLKREGGVPASDSGDGLRVIGRLFLEHALLISDVMVALELACRTHGKVRLLTSSELPLPDETRRRREPTVEEWQLKEDPTYDRTGNPSPQRLQTTRSTISTTRPATGEHAGRFIESAQRWSQADRNLELATARFGRANRDVELAIAGFGGAGRDLELATTRFERADRAIANGFEQSLTTWSNCRSSKRLLSKYGAASSPTPETRQADHDLEPEMEIDFDGV